MNVLGLDIGGSAIKGAPVDTKTGRLLGERFRIATPERVTPRRMATLAAQIAQHFDWSGPIGVGFPGVVQGSVVRTAANMHPSFIGKDLAKLIAGSTGSNVRVLNDADAAGAAEMKFGAGRGRDGTVLLLTLGTGVGSALFRDGVLVPNTELGHLPLRGRAAEKYMSAAVREEKDLSWKKWAGRINEYLALVEMLLWPDLIILGGGVSSKSEKFVPFLKTRAAVVPAQLENRAGIAGAALHGAA